MNSEDIKKLIGSSLLTISAIVGTLYGLGYVEHRTQLYIFGLDYQLDDITIITNGADFILASIIDSIRYFFSNSFSSIQSLFYSEFICSTIIFILTFFLVVFLHKYKDKTFFKVLIWLFVSAFCLNLLFFQIGLFKLSDLLQPHQSFINTIALNDYTGLENEEVIGNLYNRYVINEENTGLFEKFFSPGQNLSLLRTNYYSSTLFLLLSFGLLLFFKVKSKRVMMPVIVCLFFLPTTYSFIGKSLNYPYVKLHLKKNDSNILNKGILIGKTEKEVVLYTIKNDFKIFYIQNGQIDFIEAFGKRHVLDFTLPVKNEVNDNKEISSSSDNANLKKEKILNKTNTVLNNTKIHNFQKKEAKIKAIRNFMVKVHDIGERETVLGLKLNNIENIKDCIFMVQDNTGKNKNVEIKEKSISQNVVLLKLNKKLKFAKVFIYDKDSLEIAHQNTSLINKKAFNNLKSLKEYFPSILND